MSEPDAHNLMRSNMRTESVYFINPDPNRPADQLGSPPARDLTKLQNDVRQMSSKGATAELADRIVNLSEELKYQRGNTRAVIQEVMPLLLEALNIRLQVFEPDDPIIGMNYKQLFNTGYGIVPPEESLKYLVNSVLVWERLIGENRQPPFVTDSWMNDLYRRLAGLYAQTRQSHLAEQTRKKIRR